MVHRSNCTRLYRDLSSIHGIFLHNCFDPYSLYIVAPIVAQIEAPVTNRIAAQIPAHIAAQIEAQIVTRG